MTSVFTLTVFFIPQYSPRNTKLFRLLFFLTGTIEYNNLLSPEYNQAFCFGQTGEFKKYNVILPDGFSLTKKGQRSKRETNLFIFRLDSS